MAIYEEDGGIGENPHELWQVERDKTLTTRIGRFQLTIKTQDQLDGIILFLIQSSERQTLLASGCETDARRAMASAERMAKRFSGSNAMVLGGQSAADLVGGGFSHPFWSSTTMRDGRQR